MNPIRQRSTSTPASTPEEAEAIADKLAAQFAAGNARDPKKVEMAYRDSGHSILAKNGSSKFTFSKKKDSTAQVCQQNIKLADDLNLCITEILDTRTQRMISSNPLLVASSDFLQTNDMASRVLAQIVMRKEVKAVFDELLGPKGNSFFLRPATDYLHDDECSGSIPYSQNICFMGLAKRLFNCGEILVGIKERDKKPVINPKHKIMIDKHINWRTTELVVMSSKLHSNSSDSPVADAIAEARTWAIAEAKKHKEANEDAGADTDASNSTIAAILSVLKDQQKEIQELKEMVAKSASAKAAPLEAGGAGAGAAVGLVDSGQLRRQRIDH
jgi:hypothetical protein